MRSKAKLGIAVALVAGSMAAGAASPSPALLLATDGGRVNGQADEGVIAYLGIPYAAPPIGDNRWRSPQPIHWTGIRQANRFGPSCPQNIMRSLGPWTHEYLPTGETSEDCLTLNVWRPANTRSKLPVLVWIHGGGFTSGSSSVDIYDGAEMAKKGIIVVSINYRLGFLGSLASPEFRNTGGGNFGIEDQIAALRWVKRNVAAFGGDAKRVTIAGQSAGALSVHYLMLSKQAAGLFHQAIPQSGIGLGTNERLFLDTRSDAERHARAFLDSAGVSTIDEARKLPMDKLRVAYLKAGGIPGGVSGFGIRPYADGQVLPLDPGGAFKAGQYNDTPVLIGLTADEGSGLNPAYRTTDPARYMATMKVRFGQLAPKLIEIYPPADDAMPIPTVTRDAGAAATNVWGEERSRTSRFPMFGYMWTHVEPGPDSARYGAFHTSEVPYVFGTLSKAEERGFSDEDRRISAVMQSYWLNFVKTGNPNGSGLEVWPQFGAGGQLMELGQRFGPYPSLNPTAKAVFDEHFRLGGTLF